MKKLIKSYKLKYNQLKAHLKKEQQLKEYNWQDALDKYTILKEHLNSIKNGSFDFNKEIRHVFWFFPRWANRCGKNLLGI